MSDGTVFLVVRFFTNGALALLGRFLSDRACSPPVRFFANGASVARVQRFTGGASVARVQRVLSVPDLAPTLQRLAGLLIFLLFALLPPARAQVTGALPPIIFEQSKGTQSPPYAQIIDWWSKADKASGKIHLRSMGMTDAGFPLHLVLVSQNGDTDLSAIRKRNKRIILINNGIHPGEPDGIDASMILVRDLVSGKALLPENIVLAIIPVYNIGGCLDRSGNYRVDQNGPEEFGFRGNSQNLDLNRDFIKADSKDARAFMEIFHLVQPDVFVDNHVSNGADYQHIMTLLTSQHDKLGGEMGQFMNKRFEPGLFELMRKEGYDLVPYVNHWGMEDIKNGWQEFWDSPRYGSGYASLFNTFAFVPETHMLKPYDQRVKSTVALMKSFISFTSANSSEIAAIRSRAQAAALSATSYPVKWSLDRSQVDSFTFKGYESGEKKSDVSGLPRLYYDRSKPYTMKVPFYNHYRPDSSVSLPAAYIVPQGWWKVTDLLQLNRIAMRRLTRDTSLLVETYVIADHRAAARAYEGHHLNTGVRVTIRRETRTFRKGDWLIPASQSGSRFLFEVLEPLAEDSYFAWNFFDPILGQKEGYSAYVFEDLAADYLRSHPDLQREMGDLRLRDSAFNKSASAQLNYIYKAAGWAEPAYLRYPVARVIR